MGFWGFSVMIPMNHMISCMCIDFAILETALYEVLLSR